MANPDLVSKCPSEGVTVIITVWKRSYLQEQIEAILHQTVLPEQIWVIHYESYIDVRPVVEQFLPVFPFIYLLRCDVNLKYFGRYSLAVHAGTEYVWILDDDVMPSRSWLERSREKCRELHAVVGCTGRIIPKDDFVPERGMSGEIQKYFIGDGHDPDTMNLCPEDTLVDFACNSYFLRTRWLADFWAVWPSTLLMGEDIHLSASLKIKSNISTVVLAQRCAETSGNLKKAYGSDEHSSWTKPGFIETREGIFRDLIEGRGWKPILWQEGGPVSETDEKII